MKALVTRKVLVPAGEVWSAIEAVGRLDVWFPAIVTCTVTGNGVGAVREMDLDGGLGAMRDVVRSIDAAARRLTYERVESPFPVSSYLGTVEVFESYDGCAVVAWTVDFESDPELAEGVAAVLVDAIGAGVAGLEADLVAPGA